MPDSVPLIYLDQLLHYLQQIFVKTKQHFFFIQHVSTLQRSSSGYICYKLKSYLNTKCYYGYNVKVYKRNVKSLLLLFIHSSFILHG